MSKKKHRSKDSLIICHTIIMDEVILIHTHKIQNGERCKERHIQIMKCLRSLKKARIISYRTI